MGPQATRPPLMAWENNMTLEPPSPNEEHRIADYYVLQITCGSGFDPQGNCDDYELGTFLAESECPYVQRLWGKWDFDPLWHLKVNGWRPITEDEFRLLLLGKLLGESAHLLWRLTVEKTDLRVRSSVYTVLQWIRNDFSSISRRLQGIPTGRPRRLRGADEGEFQRN